jgi:hypothetical protein
MDATGSPPSSAIRYGQGRCLAFDPFGRLVSSTNGLHWQISRTFEPDEGPSDLDYADGLWVLVGALSTNIFLLTSEDGATWDRVALPIIPPYNGEVPTSGIKVRHGAGEWVVRVRNRLVLRSIDGRNWTLSELGAPPAGSIYDLTYGDGRWVAQVHMFGSTYPFACSTNLINWEWWKPWPADHAGHAFQSLKFFNGLWFGVTSQLVHQGGPENRSVVTSTDGTNWITRHVEQDLTDVSLINGRFVTVGYTYPAVLGAQGIAWMLTSDALTTLRQNRAGELTVVRAAGMPVAVQWTEDLQTWHTLTNLPAGQSTVTIGDAPTNATKRFYRALTP